MEERHVPLRIKHRVPPRSQDGFQSLRPQELWEHLPERPRIAILATLVRIVSSQASPDHEEVTHDNS